MSFTFDVEKHEYRLQGKVLPSVTQVLAIVNDFDRIPRAILEHARERGECLHRAVNLYNRDDLEFESLDNDTSADVYAWARFLRESGAVVIASESPVYHEQFGYAGTPDVVLDWNGRIVIPDLKSTYSVPRTVGPQTAAYAEAYRSMHAGRRPERYCIHIKDGNYKAHKRNDPADWALFLSCLNVHKFMEKAA